jgi:hypothetical protein
MQFIFMDLATFFKISKLKFISLEIERVTRSEVNQTNNCLSGFVLSPIIRSTSNNSLSTSAFLSLFPNAIGYHSAVPYY